MRRRGRVREKRASRTNRDGGMGRSGRAGWMVMGVERRLVESGLMHRTGVDGARGVAVFLPGNRKGRRSCDDSKCRRQRLVVADGRQAPGRPLAPEGREDKEEEVHRLGERRRRRDQDHLSPWYASSPETPPSPSDISPRAPPPPVVRQPFRSSSSFLSTSESSCTRHPLFLFAFRGQYLPPSPEMHPCSPFRQITSFDRSSASSISSREAHL